MHLPRILKTFQSDDIRVFIILRNIFFFLHKDYTKNNSSIISDIVKQFKFKAKESTTTKTLHCYHFWLFMGNFFTISVTPH